MLEQQPTADFCDSNPQAHVLQERFQSFGARNRCLGPVETLTTRDDNSLVKAALGEPGNGRVLLVDNGASINCAMLGGDLAGLAAKNGWAGIVINGAVRDVDELQETPLAVFALASCPRKSAKRGAGVLGKPIRLHGAYIRRGDVLAADADGIVFLSSWAATGNVA
jgi:regulator of ribonuclease activity A